LEKKNCFLARKKMSIAVISVTLGGILVGALLVYKYYFAVRQREREQRQRERESEQEEREENANNNDKRERNAVAELDALESKMSASLSVGRIPIVSACCEELLSRDCDSENGLLCKGVFRIPGSRARVNELLTMLSPIDEDRHRHVVAQEDVHTLASLLKVWLLELPAPLLDSSQYLAIRELAKNFGDGSNSRNNNNRNKSDDHDDDAAAASASSSSDGDASGDETARWRDALAPIWRTLRPLAKHVFEQVFELLGRVDELSSDNCMPVDNLATVMVPTFMWTLSQEPADIMADMVLNKQVLVNMIRYRTRRTKTKDD
jgi:RhoGAP domain